jgi:glycosyltransferase involved in cell wall biosynthesis
MNEFVSVVVPTWNRAALLRDALASLVSQDYPRERYEIIVVDDGSTDATSAVAQDYVETDSLPRVQYVRQAHTGLNAARNAGVAAAKGDLICFVDDDVEAPSAWLRAIVRGAARHLYAGCLGGPIHLRIEGRQPRMCGKEELGETELDLGPDDRTGPLIWGANMAIRRSVLDAVGLFREDLPLYGDEEEWERRLFASGGTTVYIADAWLWHRRTEADFRFGRLIKTSFVRGRLTARRLRIDGRSFSVAEEVGGIPRALSHAALHRCEWGLLNTSRRLGMVWEHVTAPRRR